MDSKIKEILKYGVMAPSGDNSQPWRFKVDRNIISIYNVPKKDTSLYNFNMSASYIALGALVENIRLASTCFGFECVVSLDVNEDSNLIATCVLTDSPNITPDPLFEFISKRSTNRKPYKKIDLDRKFLEEINTLLNDFDSVDFVIQENKQSIEYIAKASSKNEKIVLENKKLHDFLFDHITWTEEEDKVKKGFFIKTLELKGPQKFMFKILRKWSILNFLNKFGISDLISKENSKLYATSSAFLAITSKTLDKISFIKTGILMQKVWLTATKYNIYMQPVTGILFLYHRINNTNNKEVFDSKHLDLINESYLLLRKELEVKDMFITMLLRVGYAEQPSANTLRYDADF